MDVNGIDPRDQTWEIPSPTFRVCFHDGKGASDEYELSGGDVQDVLRWAEAHRRGRTYTVDVCVPRDGLGLIRLAGRDPNE
jgi:hypothetical protein